ncbi:MAG: tRNA-dihydrouridine synthase [Bdellovibrionales bacterium]|nr:tRNA-dihydrouridine synthase [Bdellovibrionales bacterium]
MIKNFWKALPRPFSVLAPMEDVTDIVFRRLVRECGAPDVLFSEFTSTDGMFSRGEHKVIHRLEIGSDESPIVAQIWGRSPENYYRAAKKLAELGFDGIDINMGCPVEKIIRSGNCSALIDEPGLAAELIAAAKEGAGDVPVSVKTRIGFQTQKTEEWANFLLEQGLAALTVHGRIAKHLSKYAAKWEEIGKVVSIRNQLGVDTVIVGNGDVLSLDEVREKHVSHGVDGVMIGRGIFENLFLFNEHERPLCERSVDEKLALLLRHIELFEEYWKERKPYRVLKKFFKIYVTHFSGASELRMKLVETETSDEASAVIDEWKAERSERL